MRTKSIFGITTLLLLIGVFSLASNIKPANSTWTGTVYIKSDGSVDPPTAPISINGNVYTIDDDINGSIVVQKNNIIIEGCGNVVRGQGSGKGIDLSQISNVMVKNVSVSNFESGIYLYSATLITLIENNVTYNTQYGILSVGSSNNEMDANYIANNRHGIYLSYSSSNNISRNSLLNNGLFVQNSYNNIVKDNLVNGKPLVYLERISDRTVEEAGQVILVNCSRINIQNLNISSATVAVQLLDTQQSNIIENDLSNNIYGIVLYGYLKGCSNISINKNIITSNSGYGVWLTSSSDNIVTENEVLNNSQGIVISYALNNIVSKNNIMYNAGCGIWFTSNANQNNISNNVIAHNGGDGILLRSSESNTINSNNVMDNNRGIYFEGSNGNRINSNDITLSHLQGIHFSSSLNNDICENNITNNGFQGLWLSTSSNNTNVYKNNVTMNNIGIVLTGSSNNSLYENYVTANTNYGIAVGDYASNNIVSGNIIVNNKFGVYILTSENNSVCRNSVIANSNHGIWLASSMNNLIKGNNITSNTNGVCISFSLSKQNSIYHNNFINNGKQVKIEEAGYPNYWDNDYPSGGNYWSNLFGQDTNNDGIVDVPFTIDADNIDRYPLKAPFIFCEGTWNTLAFNFDMVSNSSISSFQFNPDEGPFVHFNVTGADGTSGFCRITIPKSLLWTEDEWIITVGNQTIRDPTIITDENNTYIYFIYNHSTQTVTIQGTHVIPEFSSALILTLLMPTILIAITLLKTKRKRQPP